MRLTNCIYRFLNNDGEVIYIGKAKHLKQRLDRHNHLPKACYKETSKIEYFSFETKDEMELAERYLVPKEKPKYNVELKEKEFEFSIHTFDNLKWELYDKNKLSLLDMEEDDKEPNWLQKLLDDNKMTRYRLSKLTGIAESQLASIVNSDIQKENVKYGHILAIEKVFDTADSRELKRLAYSVGMLEHELETAYNKLSEVQRIELECRLEGDRKRFVQKAIRYFLNENA